MKYTSTCLTGRQASTVPSGEHAHLHHQHNPLGSPALAWVISDKSRPLTAITLANGAHQSLCLQAHLIILRHRLGLHNNGPAGSNADAVAVYDSGADDNVQVKRAVEAYEADGPSVDAPRSVLQAASSSSV